MATSLPWSAVWTVARERLRRRRAGSIGLVLLAGLGAALPMAVWAASRDTSKAYSSFVEAVEPADATLVVCPPGIELRPDTGPRPCVSHRVTDELEVIRADPHVRRAARFSYRPLDFGPTADPSRLQGFGVGLLSLEDRAPTASVLGDPIVVSGRLPRADAPDEAMIAETSVDAIGLTAGDRVWARFTGTDHELVPVTITGVVRTPLDLLPLEGANSGPGILTGPGFLADRRADLPAAYGGVAVWLDDGDIDGLAERMQTELDRLVVGFPLVGPDEADTIVQATDFEARAGIAAAGAAAVVVVFVIGQAVSRQARSEAVDRDTLVTLGLAERDLVAAAALRWAPVAAGAAALAALACAAASAFGPLGVARRGVWARAIHPDWTVVLVGSVAVFVLVMVVGASSGVRHRAAESSAPAIGSASVGRPSLQAGLGLAWRGLRGGATLPLVSAVFASAVAVATIITAAGGSASLRLVVDEPDRFGAPWDAIVQSAPEDPRALAGLADVEGIDHAAVLGGTDVSTPGDSSLWVQAFRPVAGVPLSEPSVVEGRAPSGRQEIVLGALTMRRAGLDLGDRLLVTPTGEDRAVAFEVVGRAMITDGAEPNVGHGAVVTPAGLDRIEAGGFADAPIAISFAPGADRGRTIAELKRQLPAATTPFPVPTSLLNAERVADLPLLLAIGAAVLAAVTFAHALLVSARRSRRELAICRVLGFTHGQVRTTLSTQAVALAATAAALGVPLGVIGARLGWRVLADAFGVVTPPLVPVSAALACIAGIFVLATLTALPSAGAAARRRTAEVLRSE